MALLIDLQDASTTITDLKAIDCSKAAVRSKATVRSKAIVESLELTA